MGAPDAMTMSASLKAEANNAFKAGKYSVADELYTKALKVLPGGDDDSDVTPASSDDGDTKEPIETEANGATNGTPTLTPPTSPPTPTPPPAAAAQNGSTKASEVDGAAAILLSNRATARFKLEQYALAIEDADAALARNPAYFKAYYRRGTARFALGKYRMAKSDFSLVIRRHPTNVDARRNLTECDKRIRENAFARAIDSGEDSRVCIAENIDLSGFTVPDSYDGPRLPDDGTVDEKFVLDLMEHFKNQKRLHVRYAVMLVLAAKRIMDELPNVVNIPVKDREKITVCGDVHGQYYDLANAIFSTNGLPSEKNPYLFNGDFVDRGSFSSEVMLTLLALKVWCPSCIHLTRGNHESKNMNRIYGFEGEVRSKYSATVFQLFSELFQSLPLAFILDGSSAGEHGKRAFIVHGGLFSKDGVTIDDIQREDRHREPDVGLVAEMLWSDPQEAPGWGPSKRGIGVAFGPDVTHRFLDNNNLDIVVRSHEMKDEGYEIHADGRLITIFSAPNYCDQMGNKGAYIIFHSDMKPDFRQFEAVPHPDVRPMQYASFGNGFVGM